jgi:Flp pilus assembly protein TadG
MKRSARLFLQDKSGSAAVEMALVIPTMLALMFGSMELGNYFLNAHAVTKAVRDGARYAGRIPITSYNCAPAATTGTIVAGEAEIKNLTRTGSVDGLATPRLKFWTDATTITVSVRCVPKTSYGATFSPLLGDVPVVKVKADVPYANGSLFKYLGFSSVGLYLRSEAEATVMGI